MITSRKPFPEVQIRRLSLVPIVNGLGEAGDGGNPTHWPRYIRTTDITGLFTLDPEKRVTLPPEIAATASVERDDILMCAAGATIGKSYIHNTNDTACFAGYLVRLRVNPNDALARFMAYWTQSRHFADQVASGAIKSTIENFSASRYRSIVAPIPPLPEQRAIADYLDRETAEIDAFITDQERLIELLTERRVATISRRVRQDRVWVDRAMPDSWSVTALRRVARFRTGGTPPGADFRENEGGVPWIRPDDFQPNGSATIASRFITTQQSEPLPIAECGATLVCSIGASIGKTAWVSKPSCFNQQITAVESEQHSRFMYFVMAAALPGVLCHAVGNTLPIINNERLGRVMIALPPTLDEQASVAALLDSETASIDSGVADAQCAIALSRERRAALISAAVTGQLGSYTAPLYNSPTAGPPETVRRPCETEG